jgi:hypothetical protein
MINEEVHEEVTTVSNQVPTQVVKTTKRVAPTVATGHPQEVYETKKAIFRTYQVVWYVLGCIEVLLAFRIVLKALGANPLSGFVSFIYALSDPFAIPFLGIFQTTAAGGAIFEWSTIIAGLVYALIAYGIVQLIQMIKPTTPEEVEQVVDTQ